MKINDFGGPKPSKIEPKEVKKQEEFNKIAVKTSTSNKDDQKYAPRASRRSFWRPKRHTALIDNPSTGVIFWVLGPPKVRQLD